MPETIKQSDHEPTRHRSNSMTAKRPHHVHAIRQSDRNANAPRRPRHAHAIEVNAPRRPSKWPQAFSANPLPDSSMMEAAPFSPESATMNRTATVPIP